MGLGFICSSSALDRTVIAVHKRPIRPKVKSPVRLPNPDPRKYTIIRHKTVGRHVVIEISYLGCTNYEGRKVLVFRDTTITQLRRRKVIDPHFCEDHRSPIARFAPTPLGWKLAIDVTTLSLTSSNK